MQWCGHCHPRCYKKMRATNNLSLGFSDEEKILDPQEWVSLHRWHHQGIQKMRWRKGGISNLPTKETESQITVSHLLLVVSSHPNSFGFICTGFQISISEISVSISVQERCSEFCLWCSGHWKKYSSAVALSSNNVLVTLDSHRLH